MIEVAVLGATGYTALELMRILLRHPQVRIVAATSRQEGATPVSAVHPSLVGRIDLVLEDLACVWPRAGLRRTTGIAPPPSLTSHRDRFRGNPETVYPGHFVLAVSC